MDEARIIKAIQSALVTHFWPAYPVVGGTVSSRCNCGADIRTASAWVEHLKADVIPETIRALKAEVG